MRSAPPTSPTYALLPGAPFKVAQPPAPSLQLPAGLAAVQRGVQLPGILPDGAGEAFAGVIGIFFVFGIFFLMS